MATELAIREIKRRHSPHLLSVPGVSGVGIEKDANGEYVLAVHIDTNNLEARKRLPDVIEGHRVKYIENGPFLKLSDNS